MFARYTSSIIFTVLLLGLASRASALSILGVNVNQPFDYMAAVNGGHCVDAHGLACGWQSKDPLIDPTTGLVANPLPSGQVESPVWTRDAIYTATGIDPGALDQAARVDGGGGTSGNPGSNGYAGLTLYDTNGIVIPDADIVGGIGGFQGFWSWSGSQTLDYLTVKPGTSAMVWDISDLIIGGTNDTDPNTVLVGFWDIQTGYDTTLSDYSNKNGSFNQMSHISVYSGQPVSTNKVPIPPTAWLVGGMVLLLMRRTRRR